MSISSKPKFSVPEHLNKLSGMIPAINIVLVKPSASERVVHAKPLAKDQECAICFEASGAMVSLCDAPMCKAVFCFNCISNYLRIKIEEGQVRRIRCPAIECQSILTAHHIHGYVSTELFQRYLMLKEKLRSGRVCPQPDCGQPVTSTGRKIKCSHCHITSCGDCGDVYHMFACADKTYTKWRKHSENVRACPNCHVDIEKHGGCNHMACTHCEFEFCWCCRVPWANHLDSLCTPRSFLESQSSSLGPNASIRAVTKSLVVVGATSALAVGVGIAAVVAPPVLLYNGIKQAIHDHKRSKTIKLYSEKKKLMEAKAREVKASRGL
ncbi:hypothetical protein THRCLA_21533 [Thraustotheca clavata]|uniref:RBR-type E3 ubiquitin transferase n=1 Tax=Thraustotheca clavata TaxID=74557 RepID=A0A1V9ZVF0_9STRA|nr:hypothetical protein THRCLA_21533 [Thraustotheca clavata]